jgi:hypothetical protein
MQEPEDRVIHCCACNRYVMLGDDVQEGDVVTCPFCHTRNQVRTMTVFIGQPVEEA